MASQIPTICDSLSKLFAADEKQNGVHESASATKALTAGKRTPDRIAVLQGQRGAAQRIRHSNSPNHESSGTAKAMLTST